MNRREAIKRAAWASGLALSAPAMAAALQGCAADLTPDWDPAFFTDQEAVLVADIAETIIPATPGVPGAKDVQVERFIDSWMADYVQEESRTRLRESLAAFNAAVKEQQDGKAFTELDPDAQLAMVKQANEEALSGPSGPDAAGEGIFPYFLELKQAVLTGYFTSEQVGEQVLAYNPIPGDYQGCVPLDGPSEGKAWSL